jgi:hypothetical protein
LDLNPGWVDVEKPSEAKTSELGNLAQKRRIGKGPEPFKNIG